MSMRGFSKIFAGNLPWSVSNRELGQYFSQFGRVLRVQVHFDRKLGKSKSFGFVTFNDSQSAESALSHRNHILEGNILRVDRTQSFQQKCDPFYSSVEQISLGFNMESEIADVSPELESQFDRASKHFTSLVSSFSSEEQLYFYARFKQAIEGECNIPKPSFLNPSGRRKWEAWKSMSGMTKRTAMAEYIKAVEDGDPTWCSDGSGASSVTSSWARVSRMPAPESVAPNQRSDSGDLSIAFLDGVQEGRVEEVSRLPTLDQLVTKRFEEGMTGLHWAADRGHCALVELLLQRGAAVDAQDEEGQTPLHYAASCGHKSVLRVLLCHGADATLEDKDGLTAQQVAEDLEVLELFLSPKS